MMKLVPSRPCRTPRFMSRTGAVGVVLSMLLVAFLGGCGSGASLVDEATEEGVFLFDNGAEPQGLDPHLVTGLVEHRVIKALLEGLVVEHPTDSTKVVPGVAERWESSDEADVWTFYLRKDARWSNGDALTAHDFIYAYQRILNPELGAPYVEMLHIIEGAEAYGRGETDDWNEVGVTAVDDHILRFDLIGSANYFPLLLPHYTYFPLHRGTIEARNAFARRTSDWTRPQHYVGNGPFVLAEWLPNQRITVEKSLTYWDAENVALNGIQFFPYQDRVTAVNNFRAGRLHKVDRVPYNLLDEFRRTGAPYLAEDPMFATGYIGINTRHAGLDDSRVRRALHEAIDVQQIIDRVTRNGQPARGFVPPGIAGYDYIDAYEYNPDNARRLLAAAGYPGGEGFPALTLIIANTANNRSLGEILQNTWRRELGIEVRLENKEWQVLISDMDQGNFDLFLISWIGDYVDPATFLKIMLTGGGNNRTGFSDDRYDRLVQEASGEPDHDRRLGLLAEAEAILMEERPIIPLTWSSNIYLLHPDVQGWSHEKRIMDQPWKFVELVPSGFAF